LKICGGSAASAELISGKEANSMRAKRYIKVLLVLGCPSHPML
jgi:hypothetical protein